MATSIKVMSFNMRMNTPVDGINAFPNRRARILACLKAEAPDVIGFQEITPDMRDWLIEALPNHYLIGCGRDANYGGEAPVIAFRKDTMTLISCDTVVLSNTPTVFGTRYDGLDQSSCPRTYVRALLKHRDVDEPFYAYNVHTDHKGAIARLLACNQLLQDITSHGRKFFLTGDFNAFPDAPEIKMMTACKTRAIADATATLETSFHHYGTRTTPAKIDYIFTDAATPVTAVARVEDAPAEGEPYISDHYPIYIVAEL